MKFFNRIHGIAVSTFIFSVLSCSSFCAFAESDPIELPFVPITPKITYGDINGDKLVDASDASDTLAEYAYFATSGLHALSSSQLKAADVDGSGAVDASDASYILGYYAHKATGGKLTIENFIKQ